MMNLTQMLNSSADSAPASIATRCGSRSRSWSETRERVSRLARALRELGVSRGDRVAILALNSDRYTEYYFAVWWAGAVVVPMNLRWSAKENAYALNDVTIRSETLPLSGAGKILKRELRAPFWEGQERSVN